MIQNKTLRLVEVVASLIIGLLVGMLRISQVKQTPFPEDFLAHGYSDGVLYIAFFVFCAAAILAAIFLSDFQKIKKGDTGIFSQVMLIVAAAVLILAMVFIITNEKPFGDETGKANIFGIVQVFFLALCSLAMLLRGLFGERFVPRRIMSLFPIYYICLVLLAFYRQNAKNPILSSYSFECVVLVVITYAIYIAASINFERPKVRQQIFITMLCVFITAIELIMVVMVPEYIYSIPGFTKSLFFTICGMCIYTCAMFFHAPLLEETEKGGKRTAQPKKKAADTLADMGMVQFPDESGQ